MLGSFVVAKALLCRKPAKIVMTSGSQHNCAQNLRFRVRIEPFIRQIIAQCTLGDDHTYAIRVALDFILIYAYIHNIDILRYL